MESSELRKGLSHVGSRTQQGGELAFGNNALARTFGSTCPHTVIPLPETTWAGAPDDLDPTRLLARQPVQLTSLQLQTRCFDPCSKEDAQPGYHRNDVAFVTAQEVKGTTVGGLSWVGGGLEALRLGFPARTRSTARGAEPGSQAALTVAELRRRFHTVGHVCCTHVLLLTPSKSCISRARSIYERALDVDYRNITLWLKYAEMEMKNRQVNHARNIWDRAITTLPRVNQFWYKYTYMEEMLGNVAGARQVFERWMEWQPEEQAWHSYINFELRYKEVDRARAIYERYILWTRAAWHP
ncbi:hypothetical protein CB1_016594007 [Camelus ferus]|nr:hypothetical protein CB1_016594007 [Camelus ferus]